MKLYFDLDGKKLVNPPWTGGVVRTVSFIRGDFEPLEVHFLRAGEDVGGVTQIVAVIKSAPGASAVALALCQTWTAAGTAYTGEIALDGAELNTLLAAKSSVALLFELTCFHEGKGPITAAAVACKVQNDLWRGDEAAPSALPTPDAAWVAHGHPQDLTTGQRATARANIGAMTRFDWENPITLSANMTGPVSSGKIYRLNHHAITPAFGSLAPGEMCMLVGAGTCGNLADASGNVISSHNIEDGERCVIAQRPDGRFENISTSNVIRNYGAKTIYGETTFWSPVQSQVPPSGPEDLVRLQDLTNIAGTVVNTSGASGGVGLSQTAAIPSAAESVIEFTPVQLGIGPAARFFSVLLTGPFGAIYPPAQLYAIQIVAVLPTAGSLTGARLVWHDLATPNARVARTGAIVSNKLRLGITSQDFGVGVSWSARVTRSH